MIEDFDFVCISLAFRGDRRQKVRKLFRKLGILNQMHWWIVEKHPDGGIYGCFESHWSIWTCPEFTKKYICIFEDDQLEIERSIERFKYILSYIRKYCPEKFDILNLEPGLCYPERSLPSFSGHLDDQVYFGHANHTGCYISTNEYLASIAPQLRLWYGADIDTSLYKNCRMAFVSPHIFKQKAGDSNNDGGHRDIHDPGVGKLISPLIRFIQGNFPLANLLTLELFQMGSWYLLARTKYLPELKDRRIN